MNKEERKSILDDDKFEYDNADYLTVFQRIIETIRPLDEAAVQRAAMHLDSLTKPQGSLGKLEHIAQQLAGIKGNIVSDLGKKAIVVMASDHGVCEEGVSAFPQEVTRQMVMNMLQGGAAVNVLAKHAGADVVCVDIGVKGELDHSDLIVAKVREGSGNIMREQAMTEKEALQAIVTGAHIVKQLSQQGYGLIGTGEMGIGNTTPSSAMLAVYTGISLEQAVGKGTGIDTSQLAHKREVIRQAISLHQPNGADGLEVLIKLGGLDIAGLTGVILGAAACRIPVVIDGFISTAAALTAARIAPDSRGYMIFSHLSSESGHVHMLKDVEYEPILQMEMRLGEGTGAALVFPLIEASVKIMNEMATFERAGVSGKPE